MTNTVQLKRSSVANSVPGAANLVPGELAINYTDGNLFYKNSSNVVEVIASNKFSSVTGNVDAGNLRTSGLISATGNITGNYFIGDGSQLTNLPSGNYSNANVANYLPTYSGNLVSLTGPVITTGNITGGNLISSGLISASGNVTIGTNYFIGDGSLLTNLPSGNYSNANVANYLPTYSGGFENLTGNIITVGFISGGLLSSTGNINAIGDVTGSNLLTTGIVSASSNVVGGNLRTGGLITATGNITGGNINTGGAVSATSTITSAANITGGNLLTGGAVSATSTITSAANITGGNILTNGVVTSSGNIVGSNLKATTAVITANIVGSTDLALSTTGNANIYLQPNGTGNIVLANTYINSVATPQQDYDAATKLYVDNAVTTGFTFHQPVSAATTTTLATATGGTITYTQPNGAGNGIGAKLTTTGTFDLIDTANIQTVGTRVLVKNEANAVLNGVYTWANATNIVRSADADEYGSNSTEQIGLNDYFFVQSGNVNAGSAYIVSAPAGTITFGTSNIEFSQFSSSQTYTANNQAGISLAGTVINAKVDDITTAFDGFGNIVVKTSAQLTTPNIGAATGTSLSVTGTVTAGNIAAGTGYISTAGNVISGNINTGGIVTATGGVISTANITGGNLLTGGVVSATGTVKGGNLTTSGIASVTGNVTGGNLLTGGAISAAANITGGNLDTGGSITAGVDITGGTIITSGYVTATGNVIGGALLTTGLITATGNITGGNMLTGGLISATGNILSAANISAVYFLGDGSQLTNLPTGNYSNANVAAYLPTYTGNLVSLTGPVVTSANVTGNYIIGDGSQLSSLAGANVTGTVANATYATSAGSAGTAQYVTANAQANITSVGVLTSLSSTGNITGSYFIGDGSQLTGIVSNYSNANVANYLPTYTGNLVSLTGPVSTMANVTGGNLNTAGKISAGGNIYGGNLVSAGAITAGGNVDIGANYFIGNGALLSGISGSYSNAVVANYLPTYTGNLVSLTGPVITTANVTGNYIIGDGSQLSSITGANVSGTVANATYATTAGSATTANTAQYVTANAQANITSVGILTSLSSTGNVTGGNIITSGNVSANVLVGANVTVTSTGYINLAPTANIDVNNRWIINLADPSQAQDAATKAYVDAALSNVHYHAPVNAATTTSLASTFTGASIVYNNGSSGVGANLVMSGNTYTTIDGVNIAVANNRILIKDEANAAWNGIYTYSNSTVITRTVDEDVPAQLAGGDVFFVLAGTVNDNTQWIETEVVTAIGTSNILFSQIGGATSYTAGAGLSLTGTQFNACVDGVTTAINGSNQISVKASANLTTPNIGAATGTSLSVTGNVDAGNLGTAGIVSATGTITGSSLLGTVVSVTANVTGGNILTGGLISATSTITSAANITGGNILTVGLISATANITGSYFIGNGSLLTGISGGSGSGASISNGTSNVTVVSSGGNVSVGVGGTSNVAVFATTGEYVTGLISASGNITGGNIITAGLISASGNINVEGNVNIGNADSITWANATGIRAYTYYNNNASSLDTVFL